VQQPSELEFSTFYRKFREVTGIDFNKYKQDQLQRRMLNLVDQRKINTFLELTQQVLTEPTVRTWFLDKLAINVTEVFRNPEQWEELEWILSQELLKNRKALKIWSAGCSTGAEAYSVAAILNKISTEPGHQIICTDIDDAAIRQAKSGELFGTEFRHVPVRYKDYFIQTPKGAEVHEKLKTYVSFYRHNLLGPAFGKDYDLIICRNVLIYFVEEAKETIYKNFMGAMRPGGYLFLGGSERIFNPKELGFENPKPYFYRKTNEENKWLNAS
jgi:chemotaxis protein methyltransferase CheR